MEKIVNKKFLKFLKRNKVIVLEEGEDFIKIGISSEDPYVVDLVKLYTRKRVIVEKIDSGDYETTYEDNAIFDESKSIEEIVSEGPIVKLLNEILEEAIRHNATDIHIEPYEKSLIIRYRIDGILHTFKKLPKYLHSALISRIKILSKLNIAEKRLPQDGKFNFRIGEKEYDIRVSISPTIFGENAVLRILKKSDIDIRLNKLGFSEEYLEKINRLINIPNGMLLITGPTGSGKTTTLYAMLKILNDGTRKIITVEDPVEYTIEGITQIQVNESIGLTFSKVLRSILRQDPDIIMVGEIRDKETAEISIRSALTGHLVLATLHTNDAASAFTRLINMGIENFLVASAIVGVISQRLVRVICNHCKIPYPISETEKELFDAFNITPPEKLYKGKGCEVCGNTGYLGRTVIAEIMEINEDIRKAVIKNMDASSIRDIARNYGTKPLIKDGLEKVKKSITTVSEVLRVTTL